jgi:hypothetical protein
MAVMDTTIKPKRGRRSKKEIEAAKALQNVPQDNICNSENVIIENNIEFKIECNEDNELIESKNDSNFLIEKENEGDNLIIKQASKKRGRKPKGGKIIQQTLPLPVQKESKPNIILHLKCSLKDLLCNGDYNSNYTSANVDPYSFESNNDLSYELLANKSNNSIQTNTINTDNYIESNKLYIINDTKQNDEADDIVNTNDTREIWRKLKSLEQDLHINNISDKKSACFWCSFDFDSPPVYIPKHFIKDSYHVYGCFCSPECAVAHLMEENIDSSMKFERYQLMNHIYSKIYEYKKNIKPAPNPHYMLDKFYGNLTIQEYRSLLRSERLFLIVDKPLTRILPEFHEDNDEFIINNKIIPSNNYQVKKRLQKKTPQTKSNILNEKFGIQNVLSPNQ